MLLSNRLIHEHDTYDFGASDSLMVNNFFKGIGIENYLTKYEMGAGTFYRGDNLVKKQGIPKKQDIHVIEVFHSLKKQILWIWSLDLNKFWGDEFEELKRVTKTMESTRLNRKWQDIWVKIAEAQKGELAATINKITNMGLKAEEIDSKTNEERGIELRIVYLEDTTDYRDIRRVYSN